MAVQASPNLLLLYGVDEALPAADAVNTGSLGSAHDLEAKNASGSEGAPRVSDGRTGRAVDLDISPGGTYTTTRRWMQSKYGALGSAHAAVIDPGGLASGEGFTLGLRFRWPTMETGAAGGNDVHYLWGAHPTNVTTRQYGVTLQPDSNTTPATAGRLKVWFGNWSDTVDNSGWSTTGSPANDPITGTGWYVCIVRVKYLNGTQNEVKVWLYEEDSETTYTWVQNVTRSTMALQSSFTTNTVYWALGCPVAGSDLSSHFGYHDEAWFYNKAISDDDATDVTINGIQIPWVEPDYYRADHKVRSAVTKENTDYPVPRALPTGATICRHPVDVLAQEVRTRVEAYQAGRPFALRATDYVFDPAGPYGSQRARRGERPDLTVGVWRTPGQRPWGACEDSRNIEFTLNGPRTRRGFKIRRDVDSAETDFGYNGFWTFRDYSDSLFHLYKVGTKLYSESGTEATEIDTGWSNNELPVAFTLDGRLVILSASNRGIWDGGSTVGSLGVAAPGSIGVAAGSGGTLSGDYYYAATFYDPTTGDETAPVVSSQVSPSTQKVTLTLPASAPETRFTKYRIYRTAAGGSPPNLFLIDTVNVAASYDDTGQPDGSDLIDQVTDVDGTFLAYITGEMPDTFGLGVAHKERAIYAKGSTNPERVYIGEPNEPMRLYADQWIAADGPVKALASWQSRLVIFTDTTVEIVDGSFERDSNGNMSISRSVVSRSVGAFGQNAVVTYQGQLVWMDRRGVFTLRGTEAVPLSDRIADLFPYINTNLADRIVGGWNHMTRTLWWSLPLAAFQADSLRLQTQFVMPIDEPGKWWFHSLEATFVGQFDDDRNGQRWGCMDHAGIFKELESYEGDGQEGDETGTFEDEGGSGAGISSISNNMVTVTGSPGWTTDEHRGKGVTLRDRSTGRLYYYTITSNDADTLTLNEAVNSNLEADDGYFIGGFPNYCAFAAHDFGSANRKIVRQVQYTFADLTREDLYL